MTDKVPNHVYKLALTEEVLAKSLVKLFEDFNIFVDEEKAIKLFYSILAHIMYRLDTNPGNYFKLKFIDITTDKDNMLSVKVGSDYTDDMVTPSMFYERFCGTQLLKEELEKSVDLFAKSFLGIAEKKKKEKRNLDNMIARRKKLAEEVETYRQLSKSSKVSKNKVIKQRKEDAKAIKKATNKRSMYMTNVELNYRKKWAEDKAQLELELRKKWKENKNDFPVYIA